MKAKYVGLERKTGEFEGRKYDNFVMHFVGDDRTSSYVTGDLVFTQKVKAAAWNDVVDPRLTVGMPCDILFNRYGNVEAVNALLGDDVLKPENKKG